MAMACQALGISGNVMPFHDCVMAVIPVKGERVHCQADSVAVAVSELP